jgi:Ca2+-binding RTX toxin-like protein
MWPFNRIAKRRVRRQPSSTGFRPCPEQLEGRRLMAVTLNLNAGVLTITGSANNDVATITSTSTSITVSDPIGVVSVSSPCRSSDTRISATYVLSPTCVMSVVANLGAGNDTLNATALALPINANGEAGDDTIKGGTTNDTLRGDLGNDVIYGGTGNDTIEGSQGDDFLAGDVGDDSYRFTGNLPLGADTIVEGLNSGNDSLNFSSMVNNAPGNVGIRLDLNMTSSWQTVAQTSSFSSFLSLSFSGSLSQLENVFGTERNDTIQGNNLSNVIYGNGGQDYLYGNGGGDQLYGGGGNDYLFGGGGDDGLYGGDGNDYLFGEDGNDTCMGGAGADTISGGSGWDLAYATDHITFDDRAVDALYSDSEIRYLSQFLDGDFLIP